MKNPSIRCAMQTPKDPDSRSSLKIQKPITARFSR